MRFLWDYTDDVSTITARLDSAQDTLIIHTSETDGDLVLPHGKQIVAALHIVLTGIAVSGLPPHLRMVVHDQPAHHVCTEGCSNGLHDLHEDREAPC